MEPISATIALLGMGLSAYGSYTKYEGAKAQEETQEKEIGVEKQQLALKQEMIHLSARREGMELMRNAQRARSLALAGAAAHGAQFGSGLMGGYGQISGATNVQNAKIAQDTQASDTMYDYSQQLSNLKIDYAKEGGQIALGQGITDIGSTLIKDQKQLTDLTQYGYGKIQGLLNG